MLNLTAFPVLILNAFCRDTKQPGCSLPLSPLARVFLTHQHRLIHPWVHRQTYRKRRTLRMESSLQRTPSLPDSSKSSWRSTRIQRTGPAGRNVRAQIHTSIYLLEPDECQSVSDEFPRDLYMDLGVDDRHHRILLQYLHCRHHFYRR
jgi:hypothetical protein